MLKSLSVFIVASSGVFWAKYGISNEWATIFVNVACILILSASESIFAALGFKMDSGIVGKVFSIVKTLLGISVSTSDNKSESTETGTDTDEKSDPVSDLVEKIVDDAKENLKK